MAFTLIELLMAMFILAIGLVAIASLFPVAGTLQQRATDTALARDVARSVQAMFEAVPFTASDVGADADPALFDDGKVRALLPTVTGTPWYTVLGNRCYPTGLDADNDAETNETASDVEIDGRTITTPTDPDSGAPDPEDSDFNQRSFYWVPLFRDAREGDDAREWQIFVFVVRKARDTTYTYSGGGTVANPGDSLDGNPSNGSLVPLVVEMGLSDVNVGSNTVTGSYSGGNLQDSGELQPGDQVLGSNGSIYTIVDIEKNVLTLDAYIDSPAPTSVWYAPPAAGKPSPTRNISVVIGKEYE
jgi:prepilin-type N-terminal cleavage/methylation domain-containing protein